MQQTYPEIVESVLLQVYIKRLKEVDKEKTEKKYPQGQFPQIDLLKVIRVWLPKEISKIDCLRFQDTIIYLYQRYQIGEFNSQ